MSSSLALRNGLVGQGALAGCHAVFARWGMSPAISGYVGKRRCGSWHAPPLIVVTLGALHTPALGMIHSSSATSDIARVLRRMGLSSSPVFAAAAFRALLWGDIGDIPVGTC